MSGSAAIFVLLFALFPTAYDSLRQVDLLLAALLLVLTAFELTVAPRLPGGLGLDVGIVSGIGLAAVALLKVRSGEGQLLACIGLICLCVFAAYFRPPRRLHVHLATTCTVVLAGTYLNPVLVDRVLVPLIVVSVLVGVPLMVSHLVVRLREAAMRDALTGTLNRSGLDLVAEPLAATSHRNARPVSVALIDLDAFKSYNDAHGHLAGDALLVSLTEAWAHTVRTGDVLARFGGDEFVLVLPDTGLEQADELVSRLRAAHPESPWTVGTALWLADEALYAAIGRADTAMLAGKRGRAGRPDPAPGVALSPSTAVPRQAGEPGHDREGTTSEPSPPL